MPPFAKGGDGFFPENGADRDGLLRMGQPDLLVDKGIVKARGCRQVEPSRETPIWENWVLISASQYLVRRTPIAFAASRGPDTTIACTRAAR